MRFDYLNNLIRPGVRPALMRLREENRIRLIEGDLELLPGVELLKVGGHTPGSQMIAVDTERRRIAPCCGGTGDSTARTRIFIEIR